MRITSAKPINLHTTRSYIKYSFKKSVKAMFVLIACEILLSECRSVLISAQWRTGSEIVKVSVKKPKDIGHLLKFLEKGLNFKVRRF